MRGVKGRKQLVRKPEDINLRGRQDGRRGRLIRHGITAAKVCVNVCVYMSVCLPGGLLVSWGGEGKKKQLGVSVHTGQDQFNAPNLKCSHFLKQILFFG